MPKKETLSKSIRIWLPALCWMAFIFWGSTGTFSHGHTSRIVGPIIRWLFPEASDRTIDGVHAFVRKGAHFAEYFVLAVLLWRARRQGGRTQRQDLLWVGCVTLVYACSDEFHQMFVSTRMAAMADVLIDVVGGWAGMFLAAAEERRSLTRKN
jgi:VanZ family protein